MSRSRDIPETVVLGDDVGFPRRRARLHDVQRRLERVAQGLFADEVKPVVERFERDLLVNGGGRHV